MHQQYVADTTNETAITNGQTGGASIFDEIQQNVLKVLKNNKNSVSDDAPPHFDCLSTVDTDLFLPPSLTDEASHEPQLYAVEKGELQPISSPFMVPGIYKKIDTSSNKQSKKTDLNNVYLTDSEPHGRIVRNTDFHKFYVFKDKQADGVLNEEQPRKVLLIEDTTQAEKSTLSTDVVINTKPDSLTPRKWDPLSKLAYNLLKLSNCDHNVTINRNRNEIVRTERSSNQKTIYRFIDDDELGVQPPGAILSSQGIEQAPKKFKKLGRPRKELKDTAGGIEVTNKTLACNRVLKKRKHDAISTTSTAEQPTEKPPVICSRFGRVIKLTKTESICPNLTSSNTANTFESPKNIIADLQDKDFTCNYKADSSSCVEAEKPPTPLATSSPPKRHVPPESICPTCKKIFLGRRLKRHFVQHPDHMKSPTPPPPPTTSMILSQNSTTDEMSLFRFLVSKLQKPNLSEDQRADLFLHELNDLVEQLQMRSSRFIRNTSGLHFVNAKIARVLCIPEGQYALDMSAIDAPPEPETNYDNNLLNVPSTNTRSLDYTVLSLDDTLTDEAAQKLNLSAGGKLLPPSEESLLRAVDDLVPPASISKLVPTNLLNRRLMTTSSSTSSNADESLVPHYDHASDNAVEAVSMKECNATRRASPILDLAVDFFQFKTK